MKGNYVPCSSKCHHNLYKRRRVEGAGRVTVTKYRLNKKPQCITVYSTTIVVYINMLCQLTGWLVNNQLQTVIWKRAWPSLTFGSLKVTACTTSLKKSKVAILSTGYLYVLYISQRKHRIFPYSTLNDWFLLPRWRVFTARYELGL